MSTRLNRAPENAEIPRNTGYTDSIRGGAPGKPLMGRAVISPMASGGVLHSGYFEVSLHFYMLQDTYLFFYAY